MQKIQLLLKSFLHAAGVAAYIAGVSFFMRNAEHIFGKADTFFSPIMFLLLFVLSAATTGSLVLGRPVLWCLDGRTSDAVRLFVYTLAWLFVLFLLVFILQVLR